MNDENSTLIPQQFTLSQNYPNPFNSETQISYFFSKPGKVSLVIYNLAGQMVKTLVNEYQNIGEKNISWDGKDFVGNPCPSRIYFYKLSSSERAETKKMVLLK